MGTKKSDIMAINSFWVWFSENYKNFGEHYENDELLNTLDNKIYDLGGYAWEIGPGIDTKNQLVISPGGDIDLLLDTKRIISYAPTLLDWSFYYAKPPKQWEFLFDFEKEDGSVVRIDASHWNYVLLKYDDGMFEIIIQTHDLAEFSEDDRLIACEILLDGILGEESRMLRICDIDTVDEFEDKYKMKGNNIKTLKNQFI